MAGNGNITVFINSAGEDVVAAAQIYSMLKEYNDILIVKIDGIAALAALIIVMSGTKVLTSPMSTLMIHNPMASAFGDTVEMELVNPQEFLTILQEEKSVKPQLLQQLLRLTRLWIYSIA